MKGKIIVFEGLDYSFKETNSKRLYKYIKDNITKNVLLYSFPNYKSESSNYVKRYLNEDFGKSSDVNPYEASLFYIMDRLDTVEMEYIREKYEDGYIIIFDRYTGSNLIFQSVKIEDTLKKEEFIKWCIDLEYDKLKLPKPDITIYMNMPLILSHNLMNERKHKSNTKKDGHENNYDFMNKVEITSITLVNCLKWNIINCNNIYSIKSKDEIFNEILDLLNKNNITK